MAVIDGEHYPPVIESAFAELRSAGHEVLGAVFAGGQEKTGFSDEIGGVATIGGDPCVALREAIAKWSPEAVFDLSDEPVMAYRMRHVLISTALHAGVAYEGADFRFSPPPRPRACTKPSIAVIGTGKRTGKTAVAGRIAARLLETGRAPIIVAMGRGGPEEPEVIDGSRTRLGAKELLAIADSGRHAASDYLEDALLARVPTVGCRRCGGGLAGAVGFSNVAAGVSLANQMDGDVLVLEGSGAAIPPVHADVTVLIVPASIPTEYLAGYLGPFRLLLSDLVVATMCEDPFGSPSRISALISDVYDSLGTGTGKPDGRARTVHTVFRPRPIEPVAGRRAIVATTAPKEAAGAITDHLTAECGCEVVGVTHALSDRARLKDELDQMKATAEVLLCEIKAAAVDVAARWALDRQMEVVFIDNTPMPVAGSDFDGAVSELVALADQRFQWK